MPPIVSQSLARPKDCDPGAGGLTACHPANLAPIIKRMLRRRRRLRRRIRRGVLELVLLAIVIGIGYALSRV